jgi:hypothetical protein
MSKKRRNKKILVCLWNTVIEKETKLWRIRIDLLRRYLQINKKTWKGGKNGETGYR